MSRTAWIVVVLAVLALAGAMGWAFYTSQGLGSWTGGSPILLLIIVTGTSGDRRARTTGLMVRSPSTKNARASTTARDSATTMM